MRDLAPGDLTVIDRKACQVTGIRDVPVADWDEEDEAAYQKAVTPSDGTQIRPRAERGPDGRLVSREDWSLRPVYLTVVPAGSKKREHRKGRPWAGWPRGTQMLVIPAHYPVCSSCGELYPCCHLEIEDETAEQMRRLAELEAVLPGCCWHCKQPLTRRQKTIEFPGDNLLLPGAPPAVFHRRRDGCGHAATRYEDKWVAAAAGRRRRLSCTGNLILHIDGPECSEDPYCPGPRVQHRSGFMNHRYGDYRCTRCADALARGGIGPQPDPPPYGGMIELSEKPPQDPFG